MSIVSGIVGAIGGNRGADKQADAARDAAGLSAQQFQQTREDLAPFRTSGRNALVALEYETGLRPERPYYTAADGTRSRYRGFEATPGYAFRVQEGQPGVDNALNAMGLGRSGVALKATERFRQGIAADEYENFLARLGGMAGAGQSAAAQTGAFGANAANVQGNALMAAGDARASGYQAVAGGVQNALTGIGQLAGFGLGGGFGTGWKPRATPGGLY